MINDCVQFKSVRNKAHAANSCITSMSKLEISQIWILQIVVANIRLKMGRAQISVTDLPTPKNFRQ